MNTVISAGNQAKTTKTSTSAKGNNKTSDGALSQFNANTRTNYISRLMSGNSPIVGISNSVTNINSHAHNLSRFIQRNPFQTKLTVGKPNDRFEQEADQTADRVMSSPAPLIQPTSNAEKEEEESVQTKLQRQPEEEVEESVQAKIQRQEEEGKEEPVEAKLQSFSLQRQTEEEEEEPVQTKLQRQPEEEEEETVQTKFTILRKEKEKTGIKYIVNVNEPEQEPKEVVQTKPNAFKRIYRNLSSSLSRSAESSSNTNSSTSNIESSLTGSKGRGIPVAEGTQTFMESQFDADFSGVRLHTDNQSAQMSNQMNAQAFTHGNDIYFNEGKFNPDTSEGKHLLAHELTHTVQQGASVQKNTAQKKIQNKTPYTNTHTKVQRSWLGDAWDSVSDAVGSAVDFVAEGLEAGLNWIKDQFHDFVREIPGYRLLSVVLGKDPISGSPVARSGINFIEAGLDIIPFGSLFKRKLEETGALQEAASWLDIQIAGLDISLTSILSDIENFWGGLSLSDIGNPTGVLNRAANIIRRPIGQIITFAGNVATEFLRIAKKYVISELATFVRDNTRAYPLLSVILGQDPITEEPVERNGMNLIRGFMLLSSDGEEQLRQMEETGSLKRAADWIDGAVARLDLSWETIRNIFTQAWNLISIENLVFRPIETFQQLVTLFAAPVSRIINFLIEVGLEILELIKDALLSRLSSFARETRGYPLLTVILGKDPFTETPVERNPENIIRGFMSLMDGGEEQFQQMKESGAIQRTTAWLEGAVARLGFTWEYITGLFINAWNSFSLQDLTAPFEAFARILRFFADPIVRLFAFIWEVIKKVIEILLIIMKFPVGLVGNIITKAMQAIEDIKRDPVGFIKNLLKAIKQGFSKFFDNIMKHLLNGLTGWLFGELEEAGITPPQDLSLGSIFGFVLDVLGITVERIWQKLGEKIGHERVAKVRGMIDKLTGVWTFVKDVMTRGPIAIWEYIVEKISNLWDMVIEHVQNWVVTRIVQKVTTKLLSMLDPTGIMAVVNSVIALYSAIESFIRYIQEMLEIVNSFVEGVAEIARGDVSRAAEFLENSLARAMPVAIGFLANQVGLSGLGRRIGEMIEAVREKVDEGLDWLIDKAVKAGTEFLEMVKGGVGAVKEGVKNISEWWKGKTSFKTKGGDSHKLYYESRGTTIVPIIASDNPQAVNDRLDKFERDDNAETKGKVGVARNELSKAQESSRNKLPYDDSNLVIKLKDLFETEESFGGPVKFGDVEVSPSVNYTAGTLTLGSKSNTVGKRMEASFLASNHPQGSGPGTSQSDIFSVLPTKGNVDKPEHGSRDANSMYIKGHLLNDNLGGPGKDRNLFPITQKANQEHESNIEADAKDLVNNKGYIVNYVVETQNINKKDSVLLGGDTFHPVNADFRCELSTYKKVGDKLEKKTPFFKAVTIRSTYLEPASAVSPEGDSKVDEDSARFSEHDESKVKWAPGSSRNKASKLSPLDSDEKSRLVAKDKDNVISELKKISQVGNDKANNAWNWLVNNGSSEGLGDTLIPSIKRVVKEVLNK